MSANNVLDSVMEALIRLQCSSDVLQQFTEVHQLLSNSPFDDGDGDGDLVNEALVNISQTNQDDISRPERKGAFEDNCRRAFQAICTFKRSLHTHPERECVEIERKLFRVVFSPTPRGAHVYPIYQKHDELLQTDASVSALKSSTGSGKTRCAPFFFALKALDDHMEHPFVIMTQSSDAIIKERMKDFKNILGDSVKLVRKIDDFRQILPTDPRKPVIGLFSPRHVIRLLTKAQEMKIPFVSRTRFCLDVHKRSVETDVLVSLLANELKTGTFPLHVVLMSEIPDSRLQKVFGYVNQFFVPYSPTFPVKTIQKESESYSTLDDVAATATTNAIQTMAEKAMDPGHVLVCANSNKRMGKITHAIEIRVTEMEQEGKKVSILPFQTEAATTLEAFHKRVRDIAHEKPDVLFVLLMPFPGAIEQLQKEIGEREIPNCPNVVKVIVATSLIESSLTIDGLAAVVDCGVCNRTHSQNADIQIASEGPVSRITQIQRRGRLGKVRDGVYIQITIKGEQTPKQNPPAVEVDDISRNILSLRRIRVQLEDIMNLPAPGIPRDNLMVYLKELQVIGALDEERKLTDLGNRLALFGSITPVVASAILKAAEKYEAKSTHAIIVGAFAFLVMTTENLFVEPTNPVFQRNFCEESDVFTLMSAIMETMQQHGTRKDLLAAAGFHLANAMKLVGAVEQISADVDKHGGKSKERWAAISEFYHEIDMSQFIGDILKNIQEVRPSWVSCRRATFASVCNCPEDPRLIYATDDSKGCSAEIAVHQRPGWPGVVAPGACFIMQLSQKPGGSLHGAIVHRDLSRPEVSHPVLMEVSAMRVLQFAPLLVSIYLNDSLIDFVRGVPKKSVFVAKIPILITQSTGKTVVSYIPKEMSDTARRYIEDGIRKIERLMPYVPRCCLVNYREQGVIVGVTSYGDGNFNTRVFLEDSQSTAYAIDKTTIDFLLANIAELSAPEERLLIAMTAEPFFFAGDESDEQNFAMPWVGKEKSVFGRPSHMVILSTREIPGATKLPWFCGATTPGSSLAFVGNYTTCGGAIRVSHRLDMIFGARGSVSVKGTLPPLRPGLPDSTLHPIAHVFDRYAMHCIADRKLKSDVMFRGFYVRYHALRETFASLNGVRFRDGIYTVLAELDDCDRVMRVMKSAGLTVDRIPVTRITISHQEKDCRFRKQEEFTEAVRRVCARFGSLVFSISPYKENPDKKSNFFGSIQVSLYTGKFLGPFLHEIKKELSGYATGTWLRIPAAVCHPALLSRPDVKKAFSDWATANGFSLRWVGTKPFASDDDLAKRLLSNPDTCPTIPYKLHAIPGGMNLAGIQHVLRKHNQGRGLKNRWTLMHMQKSLVTPSEVSDEEVRAFLEMASTEAGKPSSGDDLLFDYVEYCEESAECSKNQIPVYQEDGSVRFYTFCVHCCHNLLSYNLGTFFDVENEEPIMENLCQAVDPVAPIAALGEPSEGAWPAVPIGQLLWMLASEKRVRALVKTWFSVRVFQGLRSSQLFEVCPVHSAILLRAPPGREMIKCQQPGCGFYRCPDCMQWHKGRCEKAEVVLPPGYRVCPNCNRPTVKTGGCNHIHCRCGKHFCYYCGFGPTDEEDDTYRHLALVHGGCFNDPPDYKRYIENRSVTDQELDDFYAQYPQFRPPP